MKYNAFISYRRENGFLMAQVIRDRLKERGISCFLDLEEDKPGKFDETLLRAIEDAPNFILILPRNALTRCKNEDDWVRKEILAAVAHNKKIIPVMYDGFKWPQKWPEGIPEEIKQLKNQQGVSMSQEYLSAMIDKIISYMSGIPYPTNALQAGQFSTEIPRDTVAFISTIKSNLPNVATVNMAFHAGAEWRRDPDKVDLLQYILENKIQLRVIVNSSEAAKIICSHMQQPLKKYVGVDHCVEEWLELQSLYPDSVHVRISKIPLIHRTYLLQNCDSSGIVNIKYYTYGNYAPAKDIRLSFDSSTAEYALYAEEFDYLWRQASAFASQEK